MSDSTDAKPLDDALLHNMDRYWRACNYLSVGMIYLRDNPPLRESLKPEQLKNRLLGHWGSDPGQSFVLVHLDRVIRERDIKVIFISGPEHSAGSAFPCVS